MKHLVSVIVLSIFLLSCKGSNKKLSAQTSTIKIERFDKDFHSYLMQSSDTAEYRLSKTYPQLLSVLGFVAIDDSNIKDKNFYPSLKSYFSNAMLAKIYRDELKTFSNVTPYEEELSQADELLFEKTGKRLPKLVMLVSGFKSNTWVLENQISISADKYLGENYSGYQQFFQNYQRLQMQPKMLVRDFLRAYLMSELPKGGTSKMTLLGDMIKEGKVFYALSQLLPDWSNADLMGYTPDEIKWNEANEKMIWKGIVTRNQLYTSENLLIEKYMGDAPATTPVSPSSPGRVGVWLGWQIVKAYVSETKTTIPELFKTDSQLIIKGSHYNPK